MEEKDRIARIREAERLSHTAMYTNPSMGQETSWMHRPVKTVTELLPLLENRTNLRVLDLGCGTGRNSIPISRSFPGIPCRIDCVDILPIAIEKLLLSACENGLSSSIHGIVSSIENFTILPDSYDLILAVSALEHTESEDAFRQKLREIRTGLRSGGVVCLIVNSNIREIDTATDCQVPPQFEVNLPTDALRRMLYETFHGWNVLKSTSQEQSYPVPRTSGTHILQTTVVTFLAKKP